MINNYMKAYIYELIDPRNGETRYIGKTVNIYIRYKWHIKNFCGGDHRSNWIKSLSKENLLPILNVIDEVSENEWEFWEIYWISQYKAWGIKLTNFSSGGNGFSGGEKSPNFGKSRSEETKLKLSLKHTGKIFSEDHKKKLSESHKGIKQSEEIRIKRSISMSNVIKDKKWNTNRKSKPKPIQNKNYIGDKNPMFGRSVFSIWVEKYGEEIALQKKENMLSKLSKSVLQYDLDGNLINEYSSMSDCIRKTGYKRNFINRSCNDSTIYNEYLWKFKQ